MIQYVKGDILADEAEAVVNTVNTVGVMGKGIALQFKRRFPGNFKAYKLAVENGQVEPGTMFVWHTGRLNNPQYVINFPTKRHWRARSRLVDIESGLEDLARTVQELAIRSIAVPPLGCGNGGLDWTDVRRLIESHLAQLEDVDVHVYEPVGAPSPSAMARNPTRPRMTIHRAAMLLTFVNYLEPGYTLGRVEAQKLLYFLQVAGAPYERLQFVQGKFGPYADPVRNVLNHLEGHFIRGFGDADERSSMIVVAEAVEEAQAVYEQVEHAAFRQAVATVRDLTEGFNDAFGLELLASVHWVANQWQPPARNATEALAAMHSWSPRKRRRYDRAQVQAAWERLEAFDLVRTTAPDEPLPPPPADDDVPYVAEGELLTSAL